MKTCIKCNRSGVEFPKQKRNKDGLDTHCKQCRNIVNKEYRENNKESFSAMRRKHYQKNIHKMRREKRKYCATHKEEKRIYDINYREYNNEKLRLFKSNWEKSKKDDPIFKIKRNLRRRIHHVIKDGYKSASTFELIGCSAEEFKSYIEKQFEHGMSWDNYGTKGWHIDHIIPCYKFDLSNPEEQYKCFHFSNQRPLWAKDNLSRRRINLQ